MSTLSVPKPATSSGASSRSANEGTFSIADALGLAVAAIGDDRDQAARRLERKMRLGLLHRQNAGVEQHGRDADGVRARHRRRVLGLHDDEAHLRPRVLGRHEQIDVAKDAAARLVEHEIAQRAVLGDEARLLPQGFARRRRDPADDHVADLALGVAGDDVDEFGGAHGGRTFARMTLGFAFTLSEICHLWPMSVNAMTSCLSRHENDALFRRAGFTEATVHQARMARSRDIGAVAARETIGRPNSPLATDFRHPGRNISYIAGRDLGRRGNDP